VSETYAERKRRERERRIKEQRRKQQIQMAIAGGLIVAIIIVAVAILNSDFFTVKTVRIEGARHVPAQTVRAAQDAGRGVNILRYPGAKVRAILLKSPWVKDVTIKRRWPDTIEIAITERKGTYSIFDGLKYYLVAPDGVVLAVSEEPPTRVQIADLPIKSPSVGSVVASEEFKQAVAVLSSLPPALSKGLTVISARSPERITLYINGVEVLYGMAESQQEKNMVLEEIFSREGTSVISVDVRVPTNPVVKGKP